MNQGSGVAVGSSVGPISGGAGVSVSVSRITPLSVSDLTSSA
jgi:hypothetical protein